jgi:DNA-binding NtrC family response regulator
VNARVIAATNRNLDTEVTDGRFLSPLLYRLNVLVIRVPPLRDRIEDIPVLLEEIISRLAMELQLTSLPAIDRASLIALSGYDWPGNVRELRNVIERSLILSDGKKLNLYRFPRLTQVRKFGLIDQRFRRTSARFTM